jgi:rhodanese-related sulfurtransferase
MRSLSPVRGGNFVLPVFLGVALLLFLATRPDSSAPRYQVPEATLEQARALIEAGALVVDVRGVEQFGYRHIPNAVLVPLAALQTAIPASLATAKNRAIVVYCNQGLAHGPEATHLLQQAGFTNVVNLKAGIEGWAAAGLPVAKG